MTLCFVSRHLIQQIKGTLPFKKDEALEDTEILPVPGILAAEIVEQLEAALEEFRSVEDVLGFNRNWP